MTTKSKFLKGQKITWFLKQLKIIHYLRQDDFGCFLDIVTLSNVYFLRKYKLKLHVSTTESTNDHLFDAEIKDSSLQYLSCVCQCLICSF